MKNFLLDCKTMFFRCMKLNFRKPETFIIAIILPVILLLMFTFLFGGAMDGAHFDTDYINFVFVGVMAVSICQGAMTQAVIVASDIEKGVLDRFVSLPISRSSFVVAHVFSAAARTMISVALLFGAGFLIGFRTGAGFGAWMGAIGIIIGFVFAMSWFGVLFGLLCKSAEGASTVPALAQVFTFLSSAFAPTATMANGLRHFAEWQPVTPIIDTLRHLFLGVGTARGLETALWMVGIFVVGFVLSALAFKRRLKK